MCGNVGKIDRAIRLILGLALYVWMVQTRNYLGLLGFVLILTAGISWCPLYSLFHIKTAGSAPSGKLAHKH